MERPVKSNLPNRLLPVANGWSLRPPGAPEQTFATLDEAIGTLAKDAVLDLELPCSAVVFERMVLPSTDPVELLGMARLQLETTLPFVPEEISSDIAVFEQGESESKLLAVAVHHEHLDELCHGLRERRLYPKSLTVRVLQSAAACPADETVLFVAREGEDIVLAFAENAHLSYAITLEGITDAPMLLAELPQLLLSAEMEGVPSEFSRILLGSGCDDLHEVLGDFFRLPVSALPDEPEPWKPVVNLLPEPWLEELRQVDRQSQIKQRLALAGMIYLALLVGAFAYLISLDLRARSLAVKVAASQPLVQQLEDEQARWKALAPAVDPQLYTVELLNQITQSIPSEELRITEFNQEPRQLTVKAEAPSANSAIDFGERLKANTALNQFHFDMAPPAILANNRAQVSIFGKL